MLFIIFRSDLLRGKFLRKFCLYFTNENFGSKLFFHNTYASDSFNTSNPQFTEYDLF